MIEYAAAKNNPNLLFMPKLFHETMDIIFDSYEFFQIQDAMDDGRMSPHMRSLISNEMSRITMRLTSVMAWLMARKAVTSGQISDEQARAEYRIDGVDQCLERNPSLEALLPEYMIDLLDKSHKLYERVWRMDQALYEAERERDSLPTHNWH